MLTLWKESYDQPRQYIKNQRYYFTNKGPCSQGYDFSSSYVWLWVLDYKESWAPMHSCFWTVVLRLLRVPWTARRSNQSILKEVSPGCSLEGLMLKLKLQYFGHLNVESWLIWKDPNAGKDLGQEQKGNRGWDGWMASWRPWEWVWVDSGSWWTGRPGVLWFMGLQRVGHDWVNELYLTNYRNKVKSVSGSVVSRFLQPHRL